MPQTENAYQEVTVGAKSNSQRVFHLRNSIFKGNSFDGYLLNLFIPETLYNRQLKENLTQFLLENALCNGFTIPALIEQDKDTYLVLDNSVPKVKITLELKGLDHEQVTNLINTLCVFLKKRITNADLKKFEEMEVLSNEMTIIQGKNPFKLAYSSVIKRSPLGKDNPFTSIQYPDHLLSAPASASIPVLLDQCASPTKTAPIPVPAGNTASPTKTVSQGNAFEAPAYVATQMAYSPTLFSDLPAKTSQVERPANFFSGSPITDEPTRAKLDNLERLLSELGPSARPEVEKILLRTGFGQRLRAGSQGGLSALLTGTRTPPPSVSPTTPPTNPIVLPLANGSVVLAVQHEQPPQPLTAPSSGRN